MRPPHGRPFYSMSVEGAVATGAQASLPATPRISAASNFAALRTRSAFRASHSCRQGCLSSSRVRRRTCFVQNSIHVKKRLPFRTASPIMIEMTSMLWDVLRRNRNIRREPERHNQEAGGRAVRIPRSVSINRDIITAIAVIIPGYRKVSRDAERR